MAKDGPITEKGPSKASKSSKNSGKTNQGKKNSSKGSPSKDVRVGNTLIFSRHMENISTPPLPDLAPTGISISPYLGNRNVSYAGQNPYVTSSSPQLTPIQPATMSLQRIPKVDKVFSCQPTALSGVSNSSKVCIDTAVKDLSLGKDVVTSVAALANQPRPVPGVSTQHSNLEMNNFILLNSKAVQSVYTRLRQNVLPYPTVQNAILPSVNVTSQVQQRRPSFQNLMTPCTSTVASSGGSSVTGVGMPHQSQISFPITNFSQAMSLPNSGQITTTGTCTQVPQTNQVRFNGVVFYMY